MGPVHIAYVSVERGSNRRSSFSETRPDIVRTAVSHVHSRQFAAAGLSLSALHSQPLRPGCGGFGLDTASSIRYNQPWSTSPRHRDENGPLSRQERPFLLYIQQCTRHSRNRSGRHEHIDADAALPRPLIRMSRSAKFSQLFGIRFSFEHGPPLQEFIAPVIKWAHSWWWSKQRTGRREENCRLTTTLAPTLFAREDLPG